MSDITGKKPKMESKDHCGICGTPLIYGTEEELRKCVYCGKEYPSPIQCPKGHYVCDSCHGAEALDTLRQVLDSSTSTDPLAIMELVMSHPSVPMHGPEHHSILPAALIAAVRNAGYPVPDGAIEKAINRGSKVPGGWCGSHGICGSAIGVGIAVSVLTEATPLTGKQRTMANAATRHALTSILDEHPRCCKRCGRNALKAAINFLKDKMDIYLKVEKTGDCSYTGRNKECVKDQCPYYGHAVGKGI